MTKDDFLNQPLPKSDPNADLETISRTKLRGLLEVSSFELRDEYERDRGIDMFGEIKANGRHLNLRFPIQLKSTATEKMGPDGKISLSIKVSNINYLMNDGLPAIYVLYHHPSEALFYERASEVEGKLREKYPDGAYPESFTFAFHKLLDHAVLKQLHSEMISLGLLRRNLNDVLKMTADGAMLEDTIVIQKDQQVYSAAERMRFLEKYGYRLLNEAKFKTVVELEKTCYPLENVSADFHFVCGTAHYYTSQLYKALDHFKLALKRKDELSPEILNMLSYYTLQSKRSLNMIDRDRTSGYVEALTDSDYLGLHLQLEKAFAAYYTSTESDQVKLSSFQQVVDSVMADPLCDDHLQLVAESYILSVQGHQLNDILLTYLLMVRNSLENPFVDPSLYKPRKESIVRYNSYFEELKQRALAHQNRYTYNIICLNGIKVQYFKTFYTDIILGIDKQTLTINSSLNTDDLALLAEQARFVEGIANVYEELSSIENAVAALAQAYELLHLMRDFGQAQLVLERMKSLIAANDLHGLEDRLYQLENGGTAHENFAAMVIGSLSKAGDRKIEMEGLIGEMQQMDEADRKNRLDFEGRTCYVQLIPLGIFCFEHSKLEQVFEILEVIEDARQGFMNVMELPAIPVANIYHEPIMREGPLDGNAGDKGYPSLKRAYVIRKQLHEIGACKMPARSER